MRLLCVVTVITGGFLTTANNSSAQAAKGPDGYPALVKLFQQWREFEHPLMKNNVPDYSASAMAAKAAALPQLRKRLDAIDPKSWPIEQQNDYKLVKAEINGLDFNLRVLRPWARDPAFYVNVFSSRSDIPWREGPVPYPEIELYKYHFPLDADAQKDLTAKMGMIPAFLSEAKENLKESNARDLWVYGAQELRNQSTTLQSLEAGTLTVRTLGEHQQANLTGTSPELRAAVTAARKATDEFVGAAFPADLAARASAASTGRPRSTSPTPFRPLSRRFAGPRLPVEPGRQAEELRRLAVRPGGQHLDQHAASAVSAGPSLRKKARRSQRRRDLRPRTTSSPSPSAARGPSGGTNNLFFYDAYANSLPHPGGQSAESARRHGLATTRRTIAWCLRQPVRQRRARPRSTASAPASGRRTT